MSNKPTAIGPGAPLARLSRRRFLAATAGVSAVVGAGTAFPLAARADAGLVALVHTQAAGDSGPIDSMMGRLNQLSEAQGFETRTIYAQDPATYETVLRTLGDAGASIVLGTFPVISEAFKAVAPIYPDTKWIQLFGDAVDPPIGNLVTVSYDYYLGCYLSGIFGAQVSQSKQIGYIGGISIPPLNADFNALKAGVHGVPGGENMLRRPDGSVRYFSVREAARLQTFPDSWCFAGSWTDALRQLGNAVPVRLAEVIAASIAAQLRERAGRLPTWHRGARAQPHAPAH